MAAQDAQSFHWDLDDKNFKLHGRISLFILLVVFVVFLFFVLLCLYIRWACRFPGRWGPSSGPGNTDPPRHSSGRLGPHGLDPKVISSLPVLLHRQPPAAADGNIEGRDGEGSMCSICLSVFSEGEKVKMLPKCGHTFHPECVDEWLKTQSSCPLCRSCIGRIQVGDEIV